MNLLNNVGVWCLVATLFVFDSIAANDTCQDKAQSIKAAVKTCEVGYEKDLFNDILSKIASATLTVDELRTYSASDCAKVDEITDCVVQQKAALLDESCLTDSQYAHAIFSLNHVIRLNLFVCGKSNGQSLLEAMVPKDGLKCFYGNQNYTGCVRNTESTSTLPDICANIDVRMNCLRSVTNCPNDNAVESFRKLFLLYKERINC